MPRSCAIALAGLPPTERALIEGALAHAASALLPGAFIEADPARAALIIANADDAAALKDIKSRAPAGRVILLGNSDQGTGWPLVARPLRLQALMEAARRQLALMQEPDAGAVAPKSPAREGTWLSRIGRERAGFSDTQPFPLDADDEFAQTRQFAPERPRFRPAAEPPPAAEAGHDGFESTQHFAHSVPSVAPSDWEAEVAEWEQAKPQRHVDVPPASQAPSVAVGTPPVAEPSPPDVEADTVPGTLPAVDRILIVGLPGTAPAGLIRIVEGAGFPVDFAGSPVAMTEFLAKNVYQYVVLIEVSLGPQAIRLCRHIQRNPGRSSADLRLLIVASHGGLIARMRAWFAGCHAWLPIPLNQSRLLQYLRDHRSVRAHAV